MAGSKTKLTFDFLRRNVIRTVVVGRFDHDLDIAHTQIFFDDPCNIADGMVFITDVINLSRDFFIRPLQSLYIKIRHVFDVKVGAFLSAAEDLDLAVGNGMIGQKDVYKRQAEVEMTVSTGTQSELSLRLSLIHIYMIDLLFR